MRQFGLLGFPLSHSFSKGYFSEKFSNEGIPATFNNYDLSSIDQFPALIADHPNLAGLNVTIPYKQTVMPYLDALDNEAKAIGAVNVIHFRRDGGGNPFLTGYNSDYLGFYESMGPLIDQLRKRIQSGASAGTPILKALILGTGGASKAVCYGLNKLGVETLFVSRSSKEDSVEYSQLTSSHYAAYQIIVNTTPLGMNPSTETYPLLDYSLIGADHLLYDVVYNPVLTKFLQFGVERGAIVKNGLEMLHGQAEAAWRIWNS